MEPPTSISVSSLNALSQKPQNPSIEIPTTLNQDAYRIDTLCATFNTE